jgi:predicted ATPase
MSVKLSNTALHLPDLSVRGFRGIENLTISRLGRVTLFAGKNGIGKTTLLEAVRIYAARGRYPVLADMLRNREEMADSVDEDGDKRLALDLETLFHGRHISSDTYISIGPKSEEQQVHITTAPPSEEAAERLRDIIPEHFSDDDVKSLKIKFRDTNQEIPMLNSLPVSRFRRPGPWSDESQLPPEIRCESLGPSLLDNARLARLWDKVALTDDETRAVQALKLIYSDKVDRVAVIGDDRGSRLSYGRRTVVKIKGQDRPVPLKSLGDGAVRLFGVALALANSQGGFLVFDEAENGIHYSVQPDFWEMVLRTAHENNIQVFATTHSWDCVAGFAQAATDVDEVEGVLIRLERDGSRVLAVEYSEDDLKIAAEQGIEVR